MNENFPTVTECVATHGDIAMPDLQKHIEFSKLLRDQDDTERVLIDPEKKAVPLPGRPEKTSLLEKMKKTYIEKALSPVPESIRGRYEGLTEFESRLAFSVCSISAKVAGSGYRDDLAGWVDRQCEEHGVGKTRLVIVDSDFPMAAASVLPGEPPSLVISTNLLDILNDRQVKSVLGHELLHRKERGGKGYTSFFMKLAQIAATRAESLLREEHRADAFGAGIASPEDSVDALLALQDRLNHIKQFAVKLGGVMDESGVSLTCLPQGLRQIIPLRSQQFRISDESVGAGRWRKNVKDPHPPLMARIDKIFDSEVTAAKR